MRKRFSGKRRPSFHPIPFNCVTPASQRDLVLCKRLKIKTCSSRTYKPNSVHRIAPAGRSFLWAAYCCAAQATYPEVVAHRAGTRLGRTRESLPIWSCSVWGLPCLSHYCDSGALLPHLFTLTLALPPRRYVFCGTFRRMFPPHAKNAQGWGTLPDVIRHTALRSSDFPPPPLDATRATVRSSCQRIHYSGLRTSGLGRHEKPGHGVRGFSRIYSFFLLPDPRESVARSLHPLFSVPSVWQVLVQLLNLPEGVGQAFIDRGQRI
jgi:hypothetical protein